MGDLYAAPVNWIYDTIKAAAGGAGVLSYVNASNVLLGGVPQTPMQNRIPAVHVHLGEDWTSEDWSALLRTHGGDMVAVIDLAIRPEPYASADADTVYVYGKAAASKRGILTFASDVLNVLQNATDGHRAGGAALSVRYVWRANRLGDSELHGATIAAMITVQFSSGTR